MFNLPKWNVQEFCGYEPKTTFWQDFSIADVFGADAVQDTFNRAFNEWKHDVTYLTELVMVLNHKCCCHYEKNESLSRLYCELYEKTNDYALKHLKGEDLSYFYQVTD
ncbi:MAG: hypothetical protein HDS69_05825 [Bacteroidales bacterium]|nr:hypothetical protein [Bacteroidales bacterium]MBD5257375.1 hypothetical protein [Barnesiella sp.]